MLFLKMIGQWAYASLIERFDSDPPHMRLDPGTVVHVSTRRRCMVSIIFEEKSLVTHLSDHTSLVGRHSLRKPHKAKLCIAA